LEKEEEKLEAASAKGVRQNGKIKKCEGEKRDE
jgi:hypothetical protein